MNKIINLGNPLLRQESEEISPNDINSDWVNDLIKELFFVMEEKGCVGVAAPQLGVNKQLIVFGTAYTKRRTPVNEIPNSVLINPKIEIIDNELLTDYEGCLSIGDLVAKVPRYTKICYSGYDEHGNYLTKEADGLEARIIQHEVDHLHGVLFIDRVVDTKSMAFYSEIGKG